MAALNGKTILICRERSESLAFEAEFRTVGARTLFFPIFRIQWLPPETIQLDLAAVDWLLFSSPHGVEAFDNWLKSKDILPMMPDGIKIGVVGKRAAQKLTNLLPEWRVILTADHLQDLVTKIGATGARQAIHLTSVQSLENVAVTIPPTLQLERLPLYETVPNAVDAAPVLTALQERAIDVIVFPSPSAFDYFRQLVSDPALIRSVYLATLGKTTRAHLEKHGFKVAIVSDKPEAGALLDAICRCLGRQNTPI